VIAAALGDPDLDGVILERKEPKVERPGGSVSGDGDAIDGGGDPSGIDMTGGPRAGCGLGDPSFGACVLERPLAGRGRVALPHRHVTVQDRLK
jgi:hypothetical protein